MGEALRWEKGMCSLRITQLVREEGRDLGRGEEGDRGWRLGPRSLATQPSSAPAHPGPDPLPPPGPSPPHDTSRLEGKQIPLLSPQAPPSLLLHTMVLMSPCASRNEVEVQAQIVVIFAQVQREAKG